MIFSKRSSRSTANKVESLDADLGPRSALFTSGRADKYFSRDRREACAQSNRKEKNAKLTASTLAIKGPSVGDCS